MAQENRQWKGQSRGGRFGNGFFVAVISRLGIGCAYFFLAFVVIYFIPFAPKATKAVWQFNRKRMNYGRCKSIKELYMHYFVFGQTLIDKFAIRSGMKDKFSFSFENLERFEELAAEDTGMILMNSHLGSWETSSVFFSKYDKKINIVMYDAEKQEVKEAYEKNAEAAAYRAIPINKDPLDAMLKIKIALNEGEYVCFSGDRYIDRASAVEKDFLGSKALFPTGPFRIAAKCRIPVLFFFALRSGRGYKFSFIEAGRKGKPDADAMMDEYILALEKIVKENPRQWFNFFDFWKL